MKTKRDSAGIAPSPLLYLPTDGDLLNYHRKAAGTAVSGIGYRLLKPTALVTKKGIIISGSDNLQYTSGSLQGGDGSGAVYENFNPNQGSLEFWVRPNWDGDDGVVHDVFYEYVSGTEQFYLRKSVYLYWVVNTSAGQNAFYSPTTSWTAGTWYHIVALWDFKNKVDGTNYVNLYVNGVKGTVDTNSGGTPSTFASQFAIGLAPDGTNQFNGTIAGRVLNRPLTSTEVTALYASGAGHSDSFTVSPDTVWLGTYSDSDDDAVFQHRGQQISSISTVTITTSQAVGLRSWKNGDRVVVYDDATTPNVVQTTINGTPSGSTIVVTDSCAAVTGTNKWISKNLIVDPNMEHANANAYTAGDAQSTLAKDQIIVKFDTDSLKITNADATQAFARQTITTAAGEDYVFNGWHYGAATVNGASQLVDVDATAALGVTATQAGATAATWKEINFAFEAADAATTIDLGTGSVTNAEIGRWDNVQLHRNLVNNGGMEGTLATAWTQEASATMAADTSEHSGAQEMKITAGAANVGATQAITLVNAKYYTVSGWARATAGDTARIIMDTGDTTLLTIGDVTATAYTRISNTFKATGTAGNIYLRGVANTDIVWFDDCNIIQLDQAVPSTATPSTTAQSYDTGKSGQGLWRDGADTLTHPTSGNIRNDRGALAMWVNMLPYDSYTENKYLFDVANVFRCYYNYSDYKFYFECYNGTNWTTVQAVSLAQTFSAGWQHVGCSWDNGAGARISVNGATAVTDTSTWAVQSLPANMYIGSSSSSVNQIDNIIDEAVVYDQYLTAVELTNVYKEMGGT